ncbi:acetate--CoA ligase family protein [Pimelobacter simplex]|uniref:acetate--CoA ligase family protein n=1 Tax=Nocardioides simplex TaxID=2045 RepID=UPI0020B127EB|nr:acetate--CoA ligase family protein [Pimelobacter simplex]
MDPRLPAGEQSRRQRRPPRRRLAGAADPRDDPRRPGRRHPRRPDHRRLPADERHARRRPRRRRRDDGQADLRRLGLPLRHRGRLPPDAPRLAAPGLPHVRQLRRRDPGPGRPPRLPRAGARAAGRPRPAAGPRRTGAPAHRLDAKRLLAAHGVPVSRDALCASADEAARAIDDQGGPVVVKAVVDGLAHKSEHGLVRLGIADAAEGRAVVADFERIVADLPGRELAGVLVSEQVHGGVEMVVGIAPDPVFGPTVMLGVGGIAVEVYRDVSFRVPPFDRPEVHRMIDELTGSALLKGFRGTPPVDLEPLVDVVMAVQQLAADGVVTELDINPLIVLPDRVVAVDALASIPDPHENAGAVA